MTHRHLAGACVRLAGRLVWTPAPASSANEVSAMAAALGRRGCAPPPEATAGTVAAVSRSMNGSYAVSSRSIPSSHPRWLDRGGASLLLQGREGCHWKIVSMPGVRTQQFTACAAASKSTLVLVESPAKARKIEQYLGPGYQARGHTSALTAVTWVFCEHSTANHAWCPCDAAVHYNRRLVPGMRFLGRRSAKRR